MKKIIPLLLSLTLIGCTTGSKTKTNINYYSTTSTNNFSYFPEEQPPCHNNTQEYEIVSLVPQPEPIPYPTPRTIYKEVPVEVIKYKTIEKKVLPREATMADLGGEIGMKMLRKMRAAYNEN